MSTFRRMFTFKRGIIAGLLILALGNGIALSITARTAHTECMDRNQRTAATAPALAKLAAAAKADGDSHQAHVWADYLARAAKAPPVKC